MNQKIRNELKSIAEEEYRVFSSGLLPGNNNILGVCLPILRKIAKRIARSDWREYLKNAQDDYFEEVMLPDRI